MKKILVPCDFSSPSIEAFKLASEIAKANKGEVFVVNIVELPVLHNSLIVPVNAYESAYLKSLKEKANKAFEKMKEKWSGKSPTHFSMERGSVVSTINRIAARKKIDLIVMGTHGTGGLREFAVGSNTEKMVRTSKVPVIAVKKAPRLASLKDIVFPTSLDLEGKKLIDSIKSLQSLLKATIHVLFVNTPNNFTPDVYTEGRLIEFARAYKLKNATLNVFNALDKEEGIIHFTSQFKSKIVAMATHGRKGISHLMKGSIAEDVVNHIDCPIWTYTQK